MLLFLHGFLGQKEDWDPLLKFLPATLPIRALDLPYEAEDIALAIQKSIPKATLVIGYSAGGRIALELKDRFPKAYEKIIAISAHPGLKNETEKQARWKVDLEWINLLKNFSMETFLEKWYSQPLFSSFKKHPDFHTILQRRKMQNPAHLIHFLEHYSLAKKTALEMAPSTIFVYGKEDLKYAELYRTLAQVKKIFAIENAGHAAHLENPKACANVILGALDEYNRNR
jgi:2-succinyl-6-hydroxy-2,4-cyclohexadiene-1-carboxylate synthase